MSNAVRYTHTAGLVSGETVQFAEGSWPGPIGAGIAVEEDAFDLIEPHLRLAAPSWSDGHRYGTFELGVQTRSELAKRLRDSAELPSHPEADRALLRAVAIWLEERTDEKTVVNLLGV